jgi:CRISPR-associated protein Csb2
MPYIDGKNQKTTLVFDTWANVADGEMYIHWPCELTDDELVLLGQLASALGYLGRSESWVEGELAEPSSLEWDAEPCHEGVPRGRDWEQISLMAAISPEEYEIWNQQKTQAAVAPYPLPGGSKKPTAKLLRERDKALAPYPADLLSCLTKDTSWWKGHGWSQPPGSRRVLYWRRSDSLQVSVTTSPRALHRKPAAMMLLSLTTSSGNRASLPHIHRTLPQAELLHRAIVGRAANGARIDCPSLTGKDAQGELLRDHHRHAHTIPLDLDGDQHIDHVLVYAKGALCDTAQRAIRSLRRTWTKGGVGEIQVAVVGHGDLEVLRQLPGKLKANIESVLGPPGGARVWRSMTPFVAPRFLKPRGSNSLEGQVNSELASRLLPRAEQVHVDPELTRDLRHFVRRRSRGRALPPLEVSYGLRLVFSEPVSGPILLGYACHYGLGLFAAVDPR